MSYLICKKRSKFFHLVLNEVISKYQNAQYVAIIWGIINVESCNEFIKNYEREPRRKHNYVCQTSKSKYQK